MRTAFIAALATVVVLSGCALLETDTSVDQTPGYSGPPSVPTVVRAGPTGRTERGQVVRVTDGDTIRVVIDDVEERVRYIGMDTPESVDPRKTIQPYALEADKANRSLVEGRDVVLELDVSDRDRYGRLLRYVWLDEPGGWVLVNFQLVRDGHASPLTYPPDVKYQRVFLDAERAARDEGAGMWATDG